MAIRTEIDSIKPTNEKLTNMNKTHDRLISFNKYPFLVGQHRLYLATPRSTTYNICDHIKFNKTISSKFNNLKFIHYNTILNRFFLLKVSFNPSNKITKLLMINTI